jgi:hypothetical protein
MKLIHIFTLIIILSLSLYFCDKDDSINGIKIPEGAYGYTGFDSTGVKIVTGWIKIVFEDSIHLSGEWELDKIGDPQNIGPQVGSGKLLGSYDKSQIYCDLNPGYVDNNLILKGDYDDRKIAGEWNYVGFPGVINQGTFKAEKR